MSILSILHKDHINMSQLLTLLEQNLEQIREGTTPDLNLMAEAVEFISHFADIYHHPLEDQMYDYFRGRDEELTGLIYRCEKEHKELKELTEKALLPIQQTLLDGMIPMQQVLKVLEGFLQAEKNHINFEEGEIFPLIEKIASDEDWEKITKKSWLKTNSMFGEFNTNEYSEIYAELNESIVAK